MPCEYIDLFINTAKLTIHFDGGWALFKREVDFLQARNQNGYLRIIEIDSWDFSLNLKYGITYNQSMVRIHALKSDGFFIKDIKVFQEAYSLICLGWIYAPTKLPMFDKVFYFIYGLLMGKIILKITLLPSIEKLCSEQGC